MPAQLFIGERGGSRIYKVGRVGIDTGTADDGGVYTGTLKTERFTPAGQDGLCYFRRVALRLWRTSAFALTMKVWVDERRTQVYDTTGHASDQTITITRGAPTFSPEETVVEASIWARGTSIQVQIEVASDSVTGIFLPEVLEVHYLPLRGVRADPVVLTFTAPVGASVATPGVSAGSGPGAMMPDFPYAGTGASLARAGKTAGRAYVWR
jgi:hypothetical protein